jgi:UDP-N-acetylmuramyl pentapeptide phosphotransferase/UDP-N-acetylglucosamine-1-phosphate transferase
MIYIIILLFLVVVSYAYLKLAIKFNIIDKPNERSSHTKITVRGGGILFPLAIVFFFIFHDYQYPYFILGIFLVAIISFLDDIYTLSSKIRFPIHILAVGLILYQVGLFSSSWYWVFLAFFMGVGTINMFNFMDGINGITGLYSMAVLFGLIIINQQEYLFDANLMWFILLALGVFGYYNFRKKALFFAGDIGSVTIGLIIFFIGVTFTITLKSPLIVMCMVVYGADATLTLLYRKLFTQESILEPHRHHIYQKLVDHKQTPHLQVSFYYAILQIVLNVIIFYTYTKPMYLQWIVLLTIVVTLTLGYLYMFRKLKKE